ncbi:hypothetical protein BD779DRAFT_1477026 [Infundibulicybe gibba]|nr:hypothetical protein BD779DRAFT_1477026 [Infundibulicybe gibba]
MAWYSTHPSSNSVVKFGLYVRNMFGHIITRALKSSPSYYCAPDGIPDPIDQSSSGSSELVRVTLNHTVRLCEPNGQSVNGRAGGVDHVGHLLKLSRCGPLEESSRGHGKGSERASKLVEKEGRRRCGRVWFVLVGNEGSRTPSYNPAEFLDGLVEGQTLREPDVKRQPGLVKGYDIGIRVGGVFSKGAQHDDSGRISFACFW